MSAPSVHAGWAEARRVLLVRLDGMGDVLMSTPAMAAVRDSLPQATLTLLTSPAGAALAPHLPWLDRVLAYDASWVKAGAEAQQDRRSADGHADAALLARLRRGRFDAAIIFSTCTQSALPAALMCRLAGIPLRLAHAREKAYGLLSHAQPEADVLGPAMRHEVRRQLDLVGSVGMHTAHTGLRFTLRPGDGARMAARLAAAGLAPGQPYVLLHPGASAASRRYPAEAFAAAAGRLCEGALVPTPALVACAGPGEAGLLHRLREAMPRPPVVPQGPMSLGELASLVAGARVLVANNSGPVHLAAALGTPVVTLYALTNPQHTPWRVPARVLSREVPCRDCLRSTCPHGAPQCLTGVPPEAVAQAARELLAEAAP